MQMRFLCFIEEVVSSVMIMIASFNLIFKELINYNMSVCNAFSFRPTKSDFLRVYGFVSSGVDVQLPRRIANFFRSLRWDCCRWKYKRQSLDLCHCRWHVSLYRFSRYDSRTECSWRGPHPIWHPSHPSLQHYACRYHLWLSSHADHGHLRQWYQHMKYTLYKSVPYTCNWKCVN